MFLYVWLKSVFGKQNRQNLSEFSLLLVNSLLSIFWKIFLISNPKVDCFVLWGVNGPPLASSRPIWPTFELKEWRSPAVPLPCQLSSWLPDWPLGEEARSPWWGHTACRARPLLVWLSWPLIIHSHTPLFRPQQTVSSHRSKSKWCFMLFCFCLLITSA